MYMYIYIYTNIYTYMYIYIHIYVFIYTYIYTHIAESISTLLPGILRDLARCSTVCSRLLMVRVFVHVHMRVCVCVFVCVRVHLVVIAQMCCYREGSLPHIHDINQSSSHINAYLACCGIWRGAQELVRVFSLRDPVATALHAQRVCLSPCALTRSGSSCGTIPIIHTYQII